MNKIVIFTLFLSFISLQLFCQESDIDYSDERNIEIYKFLGNPVSPPNNLKELYLPKNIKEAVIKTFTEKGYEVLFLEIDIKEFPFLVYGIVKPAVDIKDTDTCAYFHLEDLFNDPKGLKYSGSTDGFLDKKYIYFASNLIPTSNVLNKEQSEIAHRRFFCRTGILIEKVMKVYWETLFTAPNLLESLLRRQATGHPDGKEPIEIYIS